MKKRNIFAILAALAVVLVVFAACGEKKPEQTDEPSTIIGANGEIYEEVTEIATEIITEIVTDKQGEAVTDKEGKTEVKTEILTTVVTVTKPYEPATNETTTGKKQENTSASEPSSEGSSVESTTTYEDVTFPEGTKIEVEYDKDGKPKNLLMQNLLASIKDKDEFAFSGTFVTGEIAGFESGMSFKMYRKSNNVASELGLGLLAVRVTVADNKMYMVYPNAKVYVDYGEMDPKESSSMTKVFDEFWTLIDSDSMTFISKSKVTLKGTTYICEEYGDSENVRKYYFNSKNELKRVESIIADDTAMILKISECSTKVNNKEFSVKGYQPVSKEKAEGMLKGMLGSFGALEGLM